MKLKLLIILFLIYLASNISFSQEIEDIGLITIGVGYTENPNEETVKFFDKLNKKITKAITKKGCASYDYCQFQCIPEVDIESIDMAEGGMKNVYVLNGSITIVAIDTLTGTIFNTYSDKIKGHATSKEKAIANAINDANLTNFNLGIEELKEKICEYYKRNKEILFSQANSMATQGNYDEAISILLNFPSVILPDYYDCLDKADEIFEQKIEELERQRIAAQRSSNDGILTKANNAISASKPEEALNILMDYQIGIDDQDQEYNRIRKLAQGSISQEKKLEYERQERAYRDARNDKERDYELAHKRIDTHVQLENKRIESHLQIENRKLDLAHEQTQAAERIENKRINAYTNIAQRQTQAAERIESQRIQALKQIAIDVKKRNHK